VGKVDLAERRCRKSFAFTDGSQKSLIFGMALALQGWLTRWMAHAGDAGEGFCDLIFLRY